MGRGRYITNDQIVALEAAKLNLSPDSLHTFAGWRKKGYRVKKGEKCVTRAKLWKCVKKVGVDDKEEKSEYQTYFLVDAYLFSIHQVEKIKEGGSPQQKKRAS